MVESPSLESTRAVSAPTEAAPRYAQTCFWARWRLRLSLGSMIALFAVAWLWSVPAWAKWSFAPGVVVSLAGIAMRIWAAGWLRKHESLATDGPYAVVRHPLYLGTGLIAIGQSLMSGVPLAAILFPLFWVMVYRPTIAEEEAFLIQKYGDDYRRFMQRTGALMPRLKRQSGICGTLKGAGRCFSWSQAWRNREYEGALTNLAAIILYAGLHYWH